MSSFEIGILIVIADVCVNQLASKVCECIKYCADARVRRVNAMMRECVEEDAEKK